MPRRIASVCVGLVAVVIAGLAPAQADPVGPVLRHELAVRGLLSS